MMVYSRWTKHDKTDVPTSVKCGCLIASTNKPCKLKPTYFIHATDTWTCGRHLQKSLPECSICMSSMKKKQEKQLSCGHVFHVKCLSTWEHKNRYPTCPVCRTVYFASGWKPHRVPQQMVVTFDETNESSEHDRILTASVLVEMAIYNYITQPTVQELLRVGGHDWNITLGNHFCAPILEDGTVIWSQTDYEHFTFKLIKVLRSAMHNNFDDTNQL